MQFDAIAAMGHPWCPLIRDDVWVNIRAEAQGQKPLHGPLEGRHLRGRRAVGSGMVQPNSALASGKNEKSTFLERFNNEMVFETW